MLVLSGALLLVLAGTAAAADTEIPVVVLPEDIPGADVIVFFGDSYTIDATQSHDNVGIVQYLFEFSDGGADIQYITAAGTYDYTFTTYGQTWVAVTAWDAAGNEGVGYFSIDVVERITGNVLIQDGTYVVDHSLYIEGDLTIDNATLGIDEGVGGMGGGGGAAPDQLGESLTPDGDLAGHWEPYYYYNYGHSGSYGTMVEDYGRKLTGEMSIKATGSSSQYRYGWEYHFNDPVDLTEYKTLSFWLHSSYSSNRMYYVYFYGTQGSYYNRYVYSYLYYQGGGYASYRGWYGYSLCLDFNHVGYPTQWYGGMSDLSQIYAFRIYTYQYRYDCWIDHIGFSTAEYGDPVTESHRPGGDYAGRWVSSYGSPSTSTKSYVGDYSVAIPLRSSYNYLDYYFDSPTDLSQFHALRLFSYWDSYYYIRWYSMQFYVYDASGHYCYYYMYSYYYFNYYAGRYYSKWYLNNIPWGTGPAYYNNGIDFTQITRIRFNSMYSYSYGTVYFDGMEWVVAGESKSGPSDNVPLAIYVDDGDTTITGDSNIVGLGKTGARIWTMDGKSTLQYATFNNVWSTYSVNAGNALESFGGIECYGDSVIDNVSFVNCNGPGLALFDGSLNLDPDTIDLTGTALKAKQAPKIIFGVSEGATGPKMFDITGWKLEASPKGSGLMFMTKDATAQVDVTIHGNDLDSNGYAGLAISNYGGSADLTVTIYDQSVDMAGTLGIVYGAGSGEWAPGTVPRLVMDNVTVEGAGEDGLRFVLKPGATDLSAHVANSTFRDCGMNGVAVMNTGFFGEADISFFNVTSGENGDNGFLSHALLNPWWDRDGNLISPVSDLGLEFDNCLVQANGAWGFMEDYQAIEDPYADNVPPWTWDGATRTSLMVDVYFFETILMENTGGGWGCMPTERWMHADLDTTKTFMNSSLDDNRGPGIFVVPNHDMWGGEGSVSDTYLIENSRIVDNSVGVNHYLGVDNYGYWSEITLKNTRIEGSDMEAILVHGSTATDGIHTWGTSRVLGSVVVVDDCRMNTAVRFMMTGADDEGGQDWKAKMGVQFTNNIVDTEEEVIYMLGAWPWCEDFTAWGRVGGNRFYKDYPEDGIEVELYGGYNLHMDFQVMDQVMNDVPGSGVDVLVGTLAQTVDPHMVGGTFSIDNVSVSNPGWNGINFSVDHRSVIGSSSRGVLEVMDSLVDGCDYGILASDMIGKVYDTTMTNTRKEAIHLAFSVFDFYSCVVGPVTTDNIKVLTKGAARMWFDVGVDVRWASGLRVLGAVVSVQDNTWSTIGVDTVSADETVPFGYVNSYTVLPDSVYSRSPYLVSATYLGLATEKLVDVTKNTVVDLVLVDDILPRLTVNMPTSGDEQTETSLKVMGLAWDMHSGLDHVEVSYNGVDWFAATGSREFEYTFDSVPEGHLMVMVKAIDFAGNERIEYIDVLVDATPPTILIIEPVQDEFMTQEATLDITGITEMGATVLVNNVEVVMDQTLFATSVELDEGYNEVRVAAMDHLGNTAVHVIKVTLDTIAPPLIVTEPEAGDTIGMRRVTVSGQTEAGARVTANGVAAPNIGGMFTVKVNLPEGESVIVVESVDAVGNVATVQVPVVIDTLEPWLELVSPMEGDVYGPDGIHVEGWVEPGSMVLVNDNAMMVENGHFEAMVSGMEGTFTVTVTVVDMAGNEYTRSVPVFVDTTAPTVMIESPEEGTMTTGQYVEVTGKLTWDEREEFRDISLLMNGGFTPFSANGDFKVRYDLEEGANPITIIVEDDVGNRNTYSLTVHRDTRAPFLQAEPTPTFNHEVWNKPATYRALVYVEGSTEPGASVTVDGAEVNVDEEGMFNVSILLPSLKEGEEVAQKEIVVIATDAAGNSKQQTIDVYRLAEEEEEKGFADYESSQYLVLLLAVFILVGAIISAWLLMRSMARRDEECEPMQSEEGR